jgi:AraC-like DNA-binding protein
MAYREIAQGGPLVACLWARDPEPEAQRRRIVPDACVDIVWTGERLVVAGPATGPAIADVAAGTAAMGVRFRVGAAGAALGLPAAELLDASVPLEDVWGVDAQRIADAVAAAPTLATLAAAVGERLARDAEPDRLVRAAATGHDVGIGERHLRRRFAHAVGFGPKTLERVLRFQRFLAIARAGDGRAPSLARLAFEAGYADQAHLTRECSRLGGLPPAALLATGTGPAGDKSVAPVTSVSFKTAGAAVATMAA